MKSADELSGQDARAMHEIDREAMRTLDDLEAWREAVIRAEHEADDRLERDGFVRAA